MKQFLIVFVLLVQWTALAQNEDLEESTEPEFVLSVTPDNIKKGFFETFEDFAANNPITGINIKVQKRSTEERLHLKDADTRKKIKHFAYFDGKTLYINAWLYSLDRYYVKTEWLNEYLMFNDVFENEDTADALGSAFGLIGALASNQEQFLFLNVETSIYYRITKGNLIRLIKSTDEELFQANKEQITDTNVLKRLLHELNQKMGKEAFYEMLFE